MTASRRRRAFGQHFLRDSKAITTIVQSTFEAVEKTNASGLLEIGPGKGAITLPLIEAFHRNSNLERFLIVEKDRDLAARWEEDLRKEEKIRIITSDFLDVDETILFEQEPLIVVSNLPYSSGTAILQKLARFPESIPTMVLMFQAEVAARLRAVPGEKAWGSLSLWIQNLWDVEKLLFVPPGAFSPPPDVNSEVVVLHARSRARISAPDGLDENERRRWEETWEKLIRIPFLHRRKMLRSGLPKGSIWTRALEEAGIEGTRRAEELNWEEWARWMECAYASSSP